MIGESRITRSGPEGQSRPSGSETNKARGKSDRLTASRSPAELLQ